MNKIKKYDNLLVWIGVAIFSSLLIFQCRIFVNDELWNFQNIYKMLNGYIIYQDANVIITPIFFWICKAILQILGENYFIFRIINMAIYSTMILIIYKIFKQLKMGKKEALLYTLCIRMFYVSNRIRRGKLQPISYHICIAGCIFFFKIL